MPILVTWKSPLSQFVRRVILQMSKWQRKLRRSKQKHSCNWWQQFGFYFFTIWITSSWFIWWLRPTLCGLYLTLVPCQHYNTAVLQYANNVHFYCSLSLNEKHLHCEQMTLTVTENCYICIRLQYIYYSQNTRSKQIN